MSGFPFLRLPLLVQWNILRKAENFSLFHLSLCSKTAHRLVKSANVVVKYMDFYFELSRGADLLFCNSEEGFIKLLISEHPKHTQIATDHMMDIFKSVQVLTVDLYWNCIIENPLWKHHKSIDNLYIKHTEDHELSVEKIKFVLEELTVTKNFTILNRVVSGFQYSKGFEQEEEVLVAFADWVHFAAVLNSKTPLIILSKTRESSIAQLKTFVTVWMAKEKLENLKKFRQVLREDGYTRQFFGEVMRGITHERLSGHVVKVRRIDGKEAEVRMYSDLFELECL